MIICENLHFSYPPVDEYTAPFPPAICDINFSVARGEFVAIVGRNGSGKSTLARHINALLLPEGGTVWIDGKNTRDANVLWEIRKTAAMVFQNPDNQLVAATVEEDVAFGPENLGVETAEIHLRVSEALTAVGMGKYAKHAPHLLSGGQKQRIALAGAFAMRPQIIVLDEPTAMLDPAGRREITKTAHNLNRAGMTVLFITHDMDEVLLASRVVVMHEGRIVMDGPPREIFSRTQELTALSLAVPQVTILAKILRGQGLDMPDTLTADEFLKHASTQSPAFRMELYTALKTIIHSKRSRVITPVSNESHTINTDNREPGTLNPCRNIPHDGDTTRNTPAAIESCILTHTLVAVETCNLTHTPASTAIETRNLTHTPVAVEMCNPTHTPAPAAIETHNLTHTYAPGTTFEQVAVHNLSLQIQPGERIAIIGHTGSGKSTLIQHFNALLAPTSGEITVRGRVGLVFQQPEYQLFESTVFKDVSFAPTQMGLAHEAIDKAVRNALYAVRLGEETWGKSPFALSGGQKRRAAIAGILAMQPDILVLDEPTAGLDPAGREEILTLLESLHQTRALTLIIVSHSMDDAARLCDRIFVLNEGKLAAEGNTEQIFSQREMLEKIGLAVPQDYYILSRLAHDYPELSHQAHDYPELSHPAHDYPELSHPTHNYPKLRGATP